MSIGRLRMVAETTDWAVGDESGPGAYHGPAAPKNAERFRLAIHALCAALHSEHCDPGEVVILLPQDQWWRLWCSLDRLIGGFMKYDGRAETSILEYHYMGITFRPKNDT